MYLSTKPCRNSRHCSVYSKLVLSAQQFCSMSTKRLQKDILRVPTSVIRIGRTQHTQKPTSACVAAFCCMCWICVLQSCRTGRMLLSSSWSVISICTLRIRATRSGRAGFVIFRLCVEYKPKKKIQSSHVERTKNRYSVHLPIPA